MARFVDQEWFRFLTCDICSLYLAFHEFAFFEPPLLPYLGGGSGTLFLQHPLVGKGEEKAEIQTINTLSSVRAGLLKRVPYLLIFMIREMKYWFPWFVILLFFFVREPCRVRDPSVRPAKEVFITTVRYQLNLSLDCCIVQWSGYTVEWSGLQRSNHGTNDLTQHISLHNIRKNLYLLNLPIGTKGFSLVFLLNFCPIVSGSYDGSGIHWKNSSICFSWLISSLAIFSFSDRKGAILNLLDACRKFQRCPVKPSPGCLGLNTEQVKV